MVCWFNNLPNWRCQSCWGAAVLAPIGIITYAAKEYFYPSEQKSAKEHATDKSSLYACLGKTVISAGISAAASTAGGAMIGMAKPQLGFMAASSGVGGAVCIGSAIVCVGGLYCCVLACGGSKDKATDEIILPSDQREVQFIQIQPGTDQMGEINPEEAMSLDQLKAHLAAKGAPSEFLEQLPRTAGDLQRLAEEKGIQSDLSALENPDVIHALKGNIAKEPGPSFMS